jgi:ATP-binding cassette subfamily C protein
MSILLTKKAAFFVAGVEARAAKEIAHIMLGQDLRRARENSREEMMFAIQDGSPAAFNSLLNSASTFVTEATLFIFICLGFLVIDPPATLAAVVYFGIIAFAIQYFLGSLLRAAGQQSTTGAVQANVAINDLVTVFRELSVIGMRDVYIDRIYKARVSAAGSAATTYYLGGMPRYIIESSLLIGLSLFVLAQALSGDLVASAGTLGVFLTGGFRLTAALLPLQSSLLNMKSALPAAITALRILEKPHHIPSTNPEPTRAISKQLDARAAGVKFSNVSFSYPDSEALVIDGMSFEIQPGEQAALIGPSGAGKSTIADLMCGLYPPRSGRVELFCPKENDLTPDSIAVSYVPQRPGIVSGTIRDNVALAVSPELVEEERVWESLKTANLETVIKALPDGLSSNLGKLQDALSGGQMQRLGLARALYTCPDLLVMDEATSALDAISEFEIKKALDNLRGKVTVVLIAHRLNTVQHADKVLLIEDGKLTDQGDFRNLVSRNPSLERIVQLMKVDEN